MPAPDPSTTWWMTLAALGVVALAAFLITWLLTDVVRLPRDAYLAALIAWTAALTVGYLAWSGTDAVAFLTRNWGWGLPGAVVSGALTARGIRAGADRRGLPAPGRRSPTGLGGAIAWEGLLYGAAEGLLLSALPVLAAWQTFMQLGWTDSVAGAFGSGVLALVASAFTIWVHHLGYREFRRNRDVLVVIAGCGILSLAYLLSRSPIAPIGGHVLMHAGAVSRGVALPPYSGGLASRAPEAPLGMAA